MRVTTVTCDRCKKEITDLNQIWPISVRINNGISTLKDQEWCRHCVLEMSLIKPYTPEDTKIIPIEPKPTIEDIIREIIREEIES